MANYSTLKAAVADVVKTNGAQAITGANLQSVLLSIINSIGGGGYIFKGVATPSTNAGTPDENVFYIGGAGTYANFGTSITVPVGSICVFKYNGSWTNELINLTRDIVFGENEEKEIERTSLTNYYYLAPSGNITYGNSDYFYYAVYNVEGINKVKIIGSIRWANPFYGFFSSATTIDSSTLIELSELHTTSTATEKTFSDVYVPAGAKVLVVNKYQNNGCSAFSQISQILNPNPTYNNINKIVFGSKVEESVENDSITNGYYLNGSGNIAQSTDFFYEVYDVEDIDEVKITASTRYHNPYYGFFSSKATISSQTLMQLSEMHEGSTASEATFENIVVPAGAKALVLNRYSGLMSYLSKYITEVLNPNPQYDNIAEDVNKVVFAGTALQSLQINQTLQSSSLTYNSVIADAGSPTYSVYVYDVENIDVVNITASIAFGNPFYGFASGSNFTTDIFYISDLNTSGSTPTQKSYENVQVPRIAKYLLVNRYNDVSTHVLSADAQVNRHIIANPVIDVMNPLKGKKWACVGDSLTEYNARTTKHYFDYVAEETGVIPLNYGRSGTGYARHREDNIAFYQRILNIDTTSDIVTIFGSFNDLAALSADFTMGSVDDTGTTTMAGCINTTISNVQSIIPLVRLGIVAPTPWDTTQPSTSGNAYNYVEMLKAICERRSIPFLDLWRHSNLHPWDAAFREVAYTKDGGSGTHPDENGHALIAPMFRQFILSLI